MKDDLYLASDPVGIALIETDCGVPRLVSNTTAMISLAVVGPMSDGIWGPAGRNVEIVRRANFRDQSQMFFFG